MKLSSFAPHYSLLEFIKEDGSLIYINSYNESKVRKLYSYTPIALMALQKMLKRYTLDEINERLLEAESKTYYDDFKTWHPMEVWMNFYLYPESTKAITDLKNDKNNHYNQSYPDLFHYAFLMGNDDNLELPVIPRLELENTGLKTIFPDGDLSEQELSKILPTLNKYFQPSELLFIALFNHMTGNALFKKELTPSNVTFNGAVYLSLMSLFQEINDEIYNVEHPTFYKPPSQLMKDFFEGDVHKAFSSLVNVNKIYSPNKSLMYDIDFDEAVEKIKAILKSGIPASEWSHLSDLPTIWIDTFSDKK